MDTIFKSPYRSIFILGFLVYLIAAIFSVGYCHSDEHFQILEFCNYKLGHSPAADLPWEFPAGIRPALQPAIALLIFKGLSLINIHNHFTYALILRILSAVFSWFIVSKTCLLLLKDFSSDLGRKSLLCMSFFMWFVPFLSVRFSSENYSALSFLTAIYLIVRHQNDIPDKKVFPLALSGLLLGFSFFFRYQIAFAILGLALWLVIIGRIYWGNLLILIISGSCAIAICIYLDYWFYGKLLLTPVNYYIANIIENKAANWGVYPWWYYFRLFFLKGIPPISVILLGLFFMGSFQRRTSIFVWCMVPFIIVHFIVGHKEMRFMFPLLFGFIYLSASGFDYLISSVRYRKLGHILFKLVLVINVPLLILRTVIPAQLYVNYYRYLYNFSSGKEITLFCREKNIYEQVDLIANFYKSPNVTCVVLRNDREFSDYLDVHKPDSVFLLERDLTVAYRYKGYSIEMLYCPLKWLLHFECKNWVSKARIWKIQELHKIETSDY
jgi:GPI mannosyltransferase 3